MADGRRYGPPRRRALLLGLDHAACRHRELLSGRPIPRWRVRCRPGRCQGFRGLITFMQVWTPQAAPRKLPDLLTFCLPLLPFAPSVGRVFVLPMRCAVGSRGSTAWTRELLPACAGVSELRELHGSHTLPVVRFAIRHGQRRPGGLHPKGRSNGCRRSRRFVGRASRRRALIGCRRGDRRSGTDPRGRQPRPGSQDHQLQSGRCPFRGGECRAGGRFRRSAATQ